MAEMKRLSRGIPDIVKHRATEKKAAKAGSDLAKMRMRRAKMGPLKRLTYDGDPLGGAEISEDPIDALNDSIKAISETVKAERAQAAAQDVEEVPEEAKIAARQSQDIKQWRDAKFYTVLVFDSGGQCQAFIDQLRVKCHLSSGGDLFIDGRHAADALGFTLPPPEYKLKSHRTDVKAAITKTKVAVMGKGKGK